MTATAFHSKADGALFGIIRALRGRARLGGCALQGRTYAEPGLQSTDGVAGACRNRTCQGSSEPWTVLTDGARGGPTRHTPFLSHQPQRLPCRIAHRATLYFSPAHGSRAPPPGPPTGKI